MLADTIVPDRFRAQYLVGLERFLDTGEGHWNQEETAEELVGRADAALYAAKRTGRDRAVVA